MPLPGTSPLTTNAPGYRCAKALASSGVVNVFRCSVNLPFTFEGSAAAAGAAGLTAGATTALGAATGAAVTGFGAATCTAAIGFGAATGAAAMGFGAAPGATASGLGAGSAATATGLGVGTEASAIGFGATGLGATAATFTGGAAGLALAPEPISWFGNVSCGGGAGAAPGAGFCT